MSYHYISPLASVGKTLNFFHKSVSINPYLIKISEKVYIVDIPKSGSSFLKSNLIIGKKALFTICGPSKPHASLYHRPLMIPGIDSTLRTSKIYAFIRNPIDRFCSTMREKLYSFPTWQPSRFYLSTGFSKNNDFMTSVDLVIKYLENSNTKLASVDKHLLPQSYFLDNLINRYNVNLRPISDLANFVQYFVNLDKLCYSYSLRTDEDVFSPSSLTSHQLKSLNNFYSYDFKLLSRISEIQ